MVVLGVARNRNALENIEKDLSECFTSIIANLSGLKSINMVADVARELGQIDVL